MFGWTALGDGGLLAPGDAERQDGSVGELPDQQRYLLEALEREGAGYRALLGGDAEEARTALGAAAEAYRRSWEAAPSRAFGRLVGTLKASILCGRAGEAAVYVRGELGGQGDSAASWYALGLTALVEGDAGLATRAAAGMRGDSAPFERAADAIAALAAGDGRAYREAVGAILADFESRGEHLTGVAISDTALVLERLAAERGMAARIESPLLP